MLLNDHWIGDYAVGVAITRFGFLLVESYEILSKTRDTQMYKMAAINTE